MKTNNIKLISWNVNGIRAVIKKGFEQFILDQDPDIICLQETKAMEDQVEEILTNYQYKYWNSADKKGYSGTAVFSKIYPETVTNGIGIDKHDHEGRVITLSFNNYYIVNVYTPNSKRGLSRLEYRCNEWDKDFLNYLNVLNSKKPVIFCGDLNVAHKEIDLANPKNNKKNAGFTKEERQGFQNYIDSNYIDTFRIFNNNPENYTWWSYMFNSRARNIGWRIDYFCVSKKIENNIKSSVIYNNILGSDHAPIGMEIQL